MVVRGLFFALTFFAAAAAAAQDEDETGTPVVPPLELAAVPETEEDIATEAALADEEARANFEAGRVAFAASRYADALQYFERAHELSGRHQLLYNIGLCHDRLGHDDQALASFEGYLAAAPDAHNRAEVEQRIDTARTRIERASHDVVPPPPPASGGDPTIGWVLLGVGAGALVGGAVMLGVGRADIGAIEGTPDGTRAWVDVAGDVERADLLTGIGAALLGVGAALGVTGIVLAVSAGGSGGETATVRLGPGGLSVTGTF